MATSVAVPRVIKSTATNAPVVAVAGLTCTNSGIYATFLSPHGDGTEGRTARLPRARPAPVRAKPYILRVPASVAVAVDVAVTILPKKMLTNAMLVPVYAVVGMLRAKSAHSFGLVWSMPSSKMLSAFISVLVKLTLTDFVEAGVTTGAVMLANAAPSLLIWKSPVP